MTVYGRREAIEAIADLAGRFMCRQHEQLWTYLLRCRLGGDRECPVILCPGWALDVVMKDHICVIIAVRSILYDIGVEHAREIPVEIRLDPDYRSLDC